MKKTLEVHFSPETEEEELNSLARYKSLLDFIKTQSKSYKLEFKDEEISNVYMEMCERKIGNFSYGFDRLLTSGKDISVQCRFEAFDEVSGDFGSLKIEINAPRDFVKSLEKEFSNKKTLTNEEKEELIEEYIKYKQNCYNFCREQN